jgi:hypothetical protein
MINLKTRIDIYENLLEQLKAQVDSAGQLAITKALQGVNINVHSMTDSQRGILTCALVTYL